MRAQARLARAGALLLCLLVPTLGLWPDRAAAQVAFPPNGQLSELAQQLDREGSYVASRVRQQVPIAAEEQLQELITRADERGVALRIAVIEQVPQGYADLGAFADALLAQMRLRDGLLVVATPQAVEARSDRLSPDQVAPLVADGQVALQREGVVAGITATADAAVDRLAAVVTPVPRPPPDEVAVNLPARAAAPQSDGVPPWPALVGIAVLLAGLLVYWWTTTRRWREVLSALEGARAAAERLASDSQVPPATAETAQRRLVAGESALETLRGLPWWQTWLWPWAPPPQLALAERAFSESLRLLGGSGVPTLAPAGAPFAAAPPIQPASPGRPAPPAAPPVASSAGLADDTTVRGDYQAAPPATREAPAAAQPPGAPPGMLAAAEPRATAATPPPPSSTPSVSPATAPTDLPPARTVPPPARPSSGRWWQRGSADGVPSASLSPEHVLAGLTPQESVACFFCGRPLVPDQVEVGAVALGGLPLQPLVCHRHAAALAAAERPGVRARLIGGHTVPWFQDPSFQPAWDFDPRDEGPSVPWDALPPPDRLFEPTPRVVVHGDDPRWTALQARR